MIEPDPAQQQSPPPAAKPKGKASIPGVEVDRDFLTRFNDKRINKKVELNMTELELRTRHIERRFVWIMGCVTGIGAFSGSAGAFLLNVYLQH